MKALATIVRSDRPLNFGLHKLRIRGVVEDDVAVVCA
jgi:translation elongation factor EF-1beta